ncbi:hypothetical protein [Nocardia brasiliensis]|uniref:hypothetical protein n=1 Tax=Nocardia brasiliensis TaxID=37326 RepID=UPI00245852EB|nr:hypothetical protein [Nocardia brasiliensis]
MRRILCTIQQGSLSRSRCRAAERALAEAYRQALDGGERVIVVWCEIPRGQSFTDNHPSTMSWVLVETEDGLPAARREPAMRAMSEAWNTVTGAGPNDLMLALVDTSLSARYLHLNRDRIRPTARPVFLLRTLTHLAVSRTTQGRFAIPANHPRS